MAGRLGLPGEPIGALQHQQDEHKQIDKDCCCTSHQTGDLHGEKEEVQPCTGREAGWHTVSSRHGPWAASPPAWSSLEGDEQGA